MTQPNMASTPLRCPQCGCIGTLTEIKDPEGNTIKSELIGFRREDGGLVCDQCGESFKAQN